MRCQRRAGHDLGHAYGDRATTAHLGRWHGAYKGRQTPGARFGSDASIRLPGPSRLAGSSTSRLWGRELDGGSEDAAAMTSDPDGMATTEPGIRSYLDGEVSLELAIPHERVSPRVGAPMPRETGELNLIACSRCLRVLRDGKWVHAETVIRELHSFEHDAPPRFAPVLCPICSLSIHLRRAQARVPAGTQMARPRGRR